MSLSSRRAWIEISSIPSFSPESIVALLTESVDWNSSNKSKVAVLFVALLTESVDWNSILIYRHQDNRVALLTESVDWNNIWITFEAVFGLSLSSRRAWIEICLEWWKEGKLKVALLTESVDWNIITKINDLRYTLSLSSRRAWIEIEEQLKKIYEATSRSPHGERGLKSIIANQSSADTLSLSSRRAWIEIGQIFHHT